jgi:hypothetical protein
MHAAATVGNGIPLLLVLTTTNSRLLVCNQRGVKGKENVKTITNSRREIHESPLTCTGGWLPGLGMFYQSQAL